MANSRRRILAQIAAYLSVLPAAAKAATRTPSAGEGPFYPTATMRRTDIDNDLVKIAGAVREAGGEIVHLKGQITDGNGKPLPELRVEIWQCDVDGNYMHPRDDRSKNFDPAFQGFGHDITDSDGRFVFRTIKPTVYPGRTPHIHVKVLENGKDRLTTQFYIKDHPGNAQDSLFRRLGSKAASVEMLFLNGPDGPTANVNVVL